MTSIETPNGHYGVWYFQVRHISVEITCFTLSHESNTWRCTFYILYRPILLHMKDLSESVAFGWKGNFHSDRQFGHYAFWSSV